jgi:endo-1,4-beta-mannosidase
MLEATHTPWIGMNVWGLAASPDVYACGASEADQGDVLQRTFTHLSDAGIEVVRFWAFQSYATNEQGRRDWRALDRVFSQAEAHHIQLIPVLGNNWADCDYWPLSKYPHGGSEKGKTGWYHEAYRHPYDGYSASYDTWVHEVTRRYAGRPALAMWELVNEPQARSTSPTDAAAFTVFLTGARDTVREIDPHTPISFGAIGNGQPGFDGLRFRLLARESDVASIHDYGRPDEPLPGGDCEMNCIRSAIRDAALESRPFYVGEAGIDTCDTPERAAKLMAKLRAAFNAGAIGYVFWAYDERARPQDCGFDIGPRSPLLAAIADYRGRPRP